MAARAMRGAVPRQLDRCSGGLFGGFGARRGTCETWLLVAVMGSRRRKCSFAKVRGADVLPGTPEDVFYLGLPRNMRENTSKYKELRENFGAAEKDKLQLIEHQFLQDLHRNSTK